MRTLRAVRTPFNRLRRRRTSRLPQLRPRLLSLLLRRRSGVKAIHVTIARRTSCRSRCSSAAISRRRARARNDAAKNTAAVVCTVYTATRQTSRCRMGLPRSSVRLASGSVFARGANARLDRRTMDQQQQQQRGCTPPTAGTSLLMEAATWDPPLLPLPLALLEAPLLLLSPPPFTFPPPLLSNPRVRSPPHRQARGGGETRLLSS